MSESESRPPNGEKVLDEAIEILEGLGHAGIRVQGERAERLRRAVERLTYPGPIAGIV